MNKLKINELKIGMIFSRNLYTSDNQVFLKANQVLSKEDLERAKELGAIKNGADGYILKPFTEESIRKK